MTRSVREGSKAITVGQMIEALSRFDPGLPVLVSGYEGGLDDMDERSPRVTLAHLNTETNSYWGAHEECDVTRPAEPYEDLNSDRYCSYCPGHRTTVVVIER